MSEGGSMNQTRTHHNGVSSFLTWHGLKTDDAQKDKEDAEQYFRNEVSLMQSKCYHTYEMMRSPKMMLNSPPKKMVQGTTL